MSKDRLGRIFGEYCENNDGVQIQKKYNQGDGLPDINLVLNVKNNIEEEENEEYNYPSVVVAGIVGKEATDHAGIEMTGVQMICKGIMGSNVARGVIIAALKSLVPHLNRADILVTSLQVLEIFTEHMEEK